MYFTLREACIYLYKLYGETKDFRYPIVDWLDDTLYLLEIYKHKDEVSVIVNDTSYSFYKASISLDNDNYIYTYYHVPEEHEDYGNADDCKIIVTIANTINNYVSNDELLYEKDFMVGELSSHKVGVYKVKTRNNLYKYLLCIYDSTRFAFGIGANNTYYRKSALVSFLNDCIDNVYLRELYDKAESDDFCSGFYVVEEDLYCFPKPLEGHEKDIEFIQ